MFLLHWQFPEKFSNPSSLNLLRPCCHSNILATNWFSVACWFPYQADCQPGRWEALRGTLLLQQIWWIAQTVSSSPMQTCRRGTFYSLCAILWYSEKGLLDPVFQSTSSCVHVVPSALQPVTKAILLCWQRPTECLLWRGKSIFVILVTHLYWCEAYSMWLLWPYYCGIEAIHLVLIDF